MLRKYFIAVLLCFSLTACAGEWTRKDTSFVQPSAYDKAVKSATYYEAIDQYSALYSQDKSNLPALLGLARNLRYAGQAEHGLTLLAEAEERFGAHPDFLTEQGKSYLATGNIGRAKDMLKKAIKAADNNWDAYSALGIVYDFQGDYSRAAGAYGRAVELCPDSASILNNMAISIALSGDLKTARKVLKKAEELRPYSEHIKGNMKLFRRIAITCPYCDKNEIARRIGATITAQDWGQHDLACEIGPAEIIETLSHADFIDLKVEFEFDKATLLPEARKTLDGLGFALASETLHKLNFRLEGHTDAVGSEAYNQELSERRAAAVKAYLVEMLGIDESRLETVGYGEARLLDKENPKSGVNRRVRVYRID